ncbi:MAG: hypothetical protein LBD80_00545 [Tannerella sp.]|jgi:hypothetical protein|nr:hypothetical protein [Tannerella sp.]
MLDWKKQLGELKSKAKQITDNSFSIGKVLKMALTEEDGIVLKNNETERSKYFVVVGQDRDKGLVGSLLVNSNVNFNVINTKELLDCQFPLRKENYAFLDYNSYLDCSELFEMDKIKIIKRGTEKGELTERDKMLIMEHLYNSDVISVKLKKRYKIVND